MVDWDVKEQHKQSYTVQIALLLYENIVIIFLNSPIITYKLVILNAKKINRGYSNFWNEYAIYFIE